jgi:hypothetical protein
MPAVFEFSLKGKEIECPVYADRVSVGTGMCKLQASFLLPGVCLFELFLVPCSADLATLHWSLYFLEIVLSCTDLITRCVLCVWYGLSVSVSVSVRDRVSSVCGPWSIRTGKHNLAASFFFGRLWVEASIFSSKQQPHSHITRSAEA